MKRHVQKLLLVWILSLFLTTHILSFLLPAQAAVSGDDFVTELTGLGFTPYLVDVDSSGRIFVQGENDIWRSVDQGSTWTKVLDGATTSNRGWLIFVDSRDYIYATIWKTGDQFYLYRSTNNGQNWTVILNGVYTLWHMAEDNNQNLYANTYCTGGFAYIYRSTDNGSSFMVWRNETGLGDHYHSVGVDRANNDIYTAMGDGEGDSFIKRFNGTHWENITDYASSGNEAQPTDVWSDGSYVYFAPDGQFKLIRIPSGETWDQREVVMDTEYVGSTANFFTDAVYYSDEGISLMGGEDGQIWGSWDGSSWVKVMDTGNDVDSFYSISNRKPIHTVERTNGKLYRINIEKEDLIRLYLSEYRQRRGAETNAANYVLEQRLENGTNYIDLTHVALSDVQASIKGLSRRNYVTNQSKIPNAGWEWGNTSGWYVNTGAGTYGTASVSSEDKANGTYSLKYEKSAGDTANGRFRPYDGANIIETMNRGDVLILSAYFKGNVSSTDRIQFYILNNTSGNTVLDDTHDLTTSWQRVVSYYICEANTLEFKLDFNLIKGIAYTTYIDSLLLQKLEVGLAYQNGRSEDAISFLEECTPVSFFSSDLDALNPSLSVGGQNVSHSGTLSNSSESTPVSLTGYLTGAVEVAANIEGSQQCIVKINGTRVLYEDSMVLKGRKDNVYFGRYYGTFSPTINTNDLVAVTNLASSIISLSYSFNKLGLTISSPSNPTSTTKVYCGVRGEPVAIYTANGTQTWSYNASTTILTLNVTHASPTRILVYWKFSGDTDNDGDVDINDLYILAVAYGSHVEEPNYNSDSDIDGNNHVNSDDLYILAEDYGELKP